MRRFIVGLVLVGSALLAPVGPAAAGSPPSNACYAANGVVRYQYGTATCLAGKGSLAIASGDGAVAIAGADWVAGGTKNTALAYGAGAHAYAGAGNGNTATVTADNATASAFGGNGNSALASGLCSYVQVMYGNDNVGIGRGVCSGVYIGGNSRSPARNDVAIATGDRSSAQAGFGGHDTALASAADSYASAQWGNFKLAIANTPGCRVDNVAPAGDYAKMFC